MLVEEAMFVKRTDHQETNRGTLGCQRFALRSDGLSPTKTRLSAACCWLKVVL